MSKNENNYPRLRALGDWGGHLANFLTFLTTNWPVTLSALFGVATGLNGWLRTFVAQPAVYISAGAFLFLLWTVIGLTTLIDRRRPRQVQTHLDYRYGLTFAGFAPNFLPTDSGMPHAGALQFAITVQNYCPGPIQYTLESCDIRVGTRAAPKYKENNITAFMARGSARISRPVGFEKGMIQEYFGAGTTEGTADFALTYGPPGEPPKRRLKISMSFGIVLPKDGVPGPKDPLGWSDAILSEIDEPF